MASTRLAWRQDITAGAMASIISLPGCVASGVLAFAPLGPGYAATGAAAGLCGAIVAGIISAIFATSSFVIASPRVGPSLILASLITTLSSNPAVASNTNLIIVAVILCAALAGLWQCIFGLAGVAKIIGEMALVELKRSATIVADEGVVCYELPLEGFTRMVAEHPMIATRILRNLARELSRRLRRTSEDLRE